MVIIVPVNIKILIIAPVNITIMIITPVNIRIMIIAPSAKKMCDTCKCKLTTTFHQTSNK